MSDQERLDRLTAKAAEKAAAEAIELNRKVASLRSQIEGLLHNRGEIKNSPMTPQETLVIAKKALIDGRKSIFFEELLIPHLRDVQNKHTSFLEPARLRVHFLEESKLFRWVFGSWVTEADLIAACQELPNIGMTEVARKEKIDAINRKIAELEKGIEKLLA